MASGQGPGPPRQGCEEEPDPSSTSEEQVARDTEEVFRSYVFYRHQQEQEAEGAAAPTDPEMVTLSLEPSSTMGQVGRQLAIIGDDINRRYDSEFQAMLQHLQPTAENAYEYFTKIASRPAAMPTGNLPAASVCSLCPPRSLCPFAPPALGPQPQQQHPIALPSELSPFTETRALTKLRPGWGSLYHLHSQLSHFAFQLGEG
ncbi:bcl-2 homologous antagonist/killer isoform X3 [Globicephala melas]|uniref:bcl-2 homologous antagonist/killer isoform X3 n=1 Tax=Globicephala melas TaxID=9731 RepID=UPI00293D3286|nr:bcl-2 homologous antagonist/killer isoform X3 [Globicephala melas]